MWEYIKRPEFAESTISLNFNMFCYTDYGRPMKPFFHGNLELLGLGRQIGQINSGDLQYFWPSYQHPLWYSESLLLKAMIHSQLLWNVLFNHSCYYFIWFFNRFSGKCCKSVRAWYAKDEKNNSWDRQESKFGYYKLQKGTVNGKAHYVSTKGNAIWYYRNKKGRGAWGVGLVRHKGTRNVSLYVRSTDDCPTEPTYDWHYLDQYKNWRDADKGFRIFCKD